MAINGAKRKAITDYWAQWYVTHVQVSGFPFPVSLCSLCGNRGVIDTTGVRSPAGVEVGRKNFCICPNGQSLRSQNADIDGW